MALGGALFHLCIAAIKAIAGNSDEAYDQIDKANDALRKPPLTETGEALSDLFDDFFNR